MDTGLKKKDLKSELLKTLRIELDVDNIKESDRLRDDLSMDSINAMYISMKMEFKLELENDDEIAHYIVKNPNLTVGELLDFICAKVKRTNA